MGQAAYEQGAILLNESMALHRELDHRRGIAWVLNDLATLLLIQGEDVAAEERLQESLRLRRELGDKRGIAECMESFAVRAIAADRLECAAQLLGVAAALREAIGAPQWPTERERQERSVGAVGRMLGQEAFAVAWAEGRAMDLESAIVSILATDR